MVRRTIQFSAIIASMLMAPISSQRAAGVLAGSETAGSASRRPSHISCPACHSTRPIRPETRLNPVVAATTCSTSDSVPVPTSVVSNQRWSRDPAARIRRSHNAVSQKWPPVTASHIHSWRNARTIDMCGR